MIEIWKDLREWKVYQSKKAKLTNSDQESLEK